MKQEIPYSSAQLLYYAWQLSRNRGGADDDKLTGVLSEARVDLNPHQVMAALFAFQSPFSKGVILADEVGLGKTIEAGIVISQFWAERKRRILIVAPATLRRQWSMELEEKFFLDSFILEKKKGISLDHLSDGKQIYICSYQFASRQAEILSRTHWNLVVYDEAHKLRNVYKSTPSMASRLKSAFSDSHKLLLTATPLQNNIEELYGLVSIIDDHYFGDLKSFKAQYCYSNKNDDIAFGDLRRRLRPIVHRTLRKQVTEYVKYTSRIPMAQEYYPAVEEQKLYNQISEYLRRDDTYGLPTSQRQLITLIFRKLMSSSTFAIGYTLKTLIDRLQTKIAPYSADKPQGWYGEHGEIAMVAEDMLGDDWDEWNEQDENEQEGEILTSDEIEGIKDEIKELQRLYDLANSISSNKKGDCLLSALHTGFQKMEELGANRKAFINYRLSHPLAQKVIALCKQNIQSQQNLLFDYSLYRYKVADIEQCAYESGWLQAHLVSFISEGQQEQHIVLTVLAEDGTALGQEFAEKLLNVPTISTGNVLVQEEASQKLASLYDNRRAALTVQIEERNKALLDAEIQHIEKWAEDQQLTLENELKDIKAKIKEKKRLLSRSENAQQTLTLEKDLNTLTRQQKRKRAEIFELEDEIEEKRDGMIDKVKAFIQQHITEEELFCVHWTLKK